MVELRTQITDQGSIGKYFALMLHIDDDELDPYEYRLLGHYRRVCGATNKPCFESTLTTAKITRMSDDKVRSTRKQLEALGRIVVEEQSGSTTKVTVCDMMASNVEKYSAHPYQKREGIDLDTPTKNGRGGLPKTGVKEESYKKKESNTSCDTASQVTNDATQTPEVIIKSTLPPIPTGYEAVYSHVYGGGGHALRHFRKIGKVSSKCGKRSLSMRGPGIPEQLGDQQCLECLILATEQPKPKTDKPRQQDPVFNAIALGSYHMAKAPAGKGGYIGVLTAGVKECGMLPDDTPATLATDLADMYAWYKKKFPDRDAPAKVETICKYLAEYRQQRRVVADDANVKFVEHDSYVAPSEVR